ncbi:MAG: tRNA preQ1(34) S-adenosylmethionine ribosyltransferase-isomerase QueA [Chromatiaceae bacterium]
MPVDAVPQDKRFSDLPSLLRRGDLVVFNDSRVIRARLLGEKETGGRVEVLIERLLAADAALAHVRASKSPRPGSRIRIADTWLSMEGRDGELFRLRSEGTSFAALMAAHGHMPLPPYIQRADMPQDVERYQTVYADRPGSVAAPTAGLHFEQGMLDRLERLGIRTARVTLHVGAGTFQPVRVPELDAHQMHSEWLEVVEDTVSAVRETQAAGGRVVAVGTTSVRSLETAARGGALAPYRGETALFIRPGYQFRVVDMLLTNFHLPQSTLLMLVCAFAGYDSTMAAYRHAVRQQYRFFSYGDAMLLERGR